MGCYAPVIKKALERVLRQGSVQGERPEPGVRENGSQEEKRSAQAEEIPGWGRRAVDLTGVSMEVLLREYIDNDKPVIFWASIDLKETYSGPEWILTDSGERFLWRSNEHCMLLVGYDEENYYFNDPWHDHGVIGYERKLVERRHEEQYEMAVSIL